MKKVIIMLLALIAVLSMSYQVSAKSKTSANDFVNLANIKLEAAQYEDAIKFCDQAIKVNPKLTNAFYIKGLSQYNLLEYEDSLKSFDSAIKLNQNHKNAYFYKGVSLRSLKKYEEALKCFNKVIEIDPKNGDAYDYKSMVLDDLGRYEEEIITCDKVIKLYPKDASAYNNKGNALYWLRRYQEAIKCYDMAIELDKQLAHAYNGKGNALHFLGKHQDAIDWYIKTITIDPIYGDAYYGLGIELSALKKYEDAIKFFDEYILLDPDYVPTYVEKGDALYKLGKYDDAIKSYDIAIKKSPKDPDYYYKKSCALVLLGKTEESISELRKAIELDDSYIIIASNDKVFENIKDTTEFKDIIVDKLAFLKDKFLNADILENDRFDNVKLSEATSSGNIEFDAKAIDSVLSYLNNMLQGKIYDDTTAKNYVSSDSPYIEVIASIGKKYNVAISSGKNLSLDVSKKEIYAVGKDNDIIKTFIVKVHEILKVSSSLIEADDWYVVVKEGDSWKVYGALVLKDVL